MTMEIKTACPRCQSLMQTVAGAPVCPRCELAGALSGQALAGDTAAEMLGNYVIESLIAHGGMGAVYRAYHRDTGKSVAIKTLLAGRLAGNESRLRFFREARLAAQLQHRHIVPTLDVGESDGIPFLVMEEMPGRNLADAVRDGPLDPLKAARLIAKVAEAIAHAHDQGVLHRDLKPANILLDAAGEPRVTDFGLARLMDGHTTELTMTGQMLGSPGYLPPERVPRADDSRAITAETSGVASDVYSLGATLYHLLTGRPPFQAATIEAVLAQVSRAEPISIRKLNPSVSSKLEAICLKCLEKDPRRRYADMRDFARDLGRFQNGEPVQARLPGQLRRAWKWCRRNPAQAGAGAAVLGLLLVVSIGSPIAAVLINRERHLAATEAVKSRQVAAFLQSMLEGVKPKVAVGRDTALLRDILDQTAKRLETEFQNQPEVEAELRFTIGEAYDALELFGIAAQHLRVAWALQRRLSGDEHPDTLKAKLALARALEADDQADEAEMLSREVFETMRARFGPDDPRPIEALHVRGNALKRLGRYEVSATALREVLNYRKSHPGKQEWAAASAAQALGWVLTHTARYDDAAACFEFSLNEARRLGLTNELDTAQAMGSLGFTRALQGRYAEGDSLLAESLVVKRRFLAEDNPDIARVYHFMAWSLLAQGRYAEAASTLESSWELAAKHPGESLDLKHDLALLAIRNCASWLTNNPAATPQTQVWQDRLAELERQHPELRGKP